MAASLHKRIFMNKFWALIVASIVFSTGCNRPATPAIAKPSAAHAASGASLGTEDASWGTSAHLMKASSKAQAGHPVFPYSLVSGGVYSTVELKRAFTTSESLRAHYKNFDFKHVRLIRIKNNTPAFVSYRKDGKIFWTRRKLTLHAGELVLADGHYLVRARCANQISFVPQTPVDAIPSNVEDRLDAPVMPTPIDYSRLQEVGSPLVPPIELSPAATTLARAYMPSAALPMLRMTPVCTNCGGSQNTPPSNPPQNPQPPNTPQKPVPMPDADGSMLLVVGLLLMASLFILRSQKRT
jgi:hypothetical protein